jgi:membrane protein
MRAFVVFWFNVVRDAAAKWSNGNAFAQSGALAFFTVFSLAPVTIITVGIVGAVLGSEAARGEISEQLEGVIGVEAAELVETAIASSSIDAGGLFPTLIGVATLLIGATTVFAQMQSAFNAIWEVVPKPTRSSILILIRQRVLSLTIVLSIGFVLLVSLLLSVALRAVIVFAEGWVPLHALLAMTLEWALSLTVISVLFATMFKVLPDVRLAWRHVWLAALVTALLFTLGRTLIAMYLAHTATASTFGAAGSLVVLLMWVYYSSLILLFGVAFSRAHCEARGDHIVTSEAAVAVHTEVIEVSSNADLPDAEP